jgi:hypothetical protein
VIAAVPLAAATLAVSAWPARVVVAAPGHTTIHVSNPGPDAVALAAAASGYALDVRGRPRVTPRRGWLAVRPAHLRLPPNGSAELDVAVARPRGAPPGDHASLVLLTTEPPSGRRVVARLRLGVVVVARVPGVLVHRLVLGGLHVVRRRRGTVVDLAVVNRGNLDEWIGARRIALRLRRHGAVVATLWTVPRRLLARSAGLVRLACRRPIRGPVTAVVEVARPRDGVPVLRRTLRLRL